MIVHSIKHSQVWNARIAGSLQLISEQFEVILGSGQSLQYLESLSGGFVELGEAPLESGDGRMGQSIQQ